MGRGVACQKEVSGGREFIAMAKKGSTIGGFVFNVFNIGFTVIMFVLPTIALGYWYLYMRQPAQPVAAQQQVNAPVVEPGATRSTAKSIVSREPKTPTPRSSFFSDAPASTQQNLDTKDTSQRVKRINERDTYEMREWSDPSGKFTVSARFYSATGDQIKLITKDDRRIDVPIAKLCDVDKEYLRGVFKKKGVRASF